MATFTERLKELRKSKGITLEKLAEELGTAKSTLSRYENGLREPKKDFLEMLSEYFDVSVDYLLGGTNTKNNNNNNLIKEKDVEEILEDTMSEILSQDGLMLNGEILDENDLMLLKKAIKNGIEYAKSMKSKK